MNNTIHQITKHMKKNILLLFYLFLALPSFAQFNSQTADLAGMFPAATEESIVRVYNDQYAVGYFNDGTNGYIYLSEITGFYSPGLPSLNVVRAVQLPILVNIYDMRCHGKKVYFCGSYGSQPLYGWFEIDELISNSAVGYEAFWLPTALTPTLSINQLSKLLVFDDPTGVPHIVAAGKNTTPPYEEYIVDITGYSNVRCAPLLMPVGSDQQHIDDVVECGNYVAFIGSDHNTSVSNRAFYARRVQKPNIFDAMIDTLYMFYSSDSNCMPMYRTASTTLNEECIAVAHQGCSEGYDARMARIAVGNEMTCLAVQHCPGLRRTYKKELAYNPQTMKLTLLGVLSEPPEYAQDIVEFRPFEPLPYLARHIIPMHEYFSSLAMFENGAAIAVSKTEWYLQRIGATTGSSCRTIQIMPVSAADEYDINLSFDHLTCFPSTATYNSSSISVVKFNTNTTCTK